MTWKLNLIDIRVRLRKMAQSDVLALSATSDLETAADAIELLMREREELRHALGEIKDNEANCPIAAQFAADKLRDIKGV